jgi:hypothetical protein
METRGGGSVTEIVLHTGNAALMPQMTVAASTERYNVMRGFIKSVMNDGVDYGKVPGTDKNTLLKPGAEKLCALFGLTVRFVLAEKTEDWTGRDHDGEMFFYYSYRCQLWRGADLIAESDGSCNSWEKKYRWRTGERVCPDCQAAAIKKSKFPPKGRPQEKPGWYCFAKIGGCGMEFAATDPAIIGQEGGRVPNPDVADLVNTFQKMAQKRAFVGTTLIAVNASEYFTQDVEDMGYIDVDPRFMQEVAPPPPAPTIQEVLPALSPQQYATINELGVELHDEWWLEELPKMVKEITGGEIDDARQLSPDEAELLIVRLREALAAQAQPA